MNMLSNLISSFSKISWWRGKVKWNIKESKNKSEENCIYYVQFRRGPSLGDLDSPNLLNHSAGGCPRRNYLDASRFGSERATGEVQFECFRRWFKTPRGKLVNKEEQIRVGLFKNHPQHPFSFIFFLRLLHLPLLLFFWIGIKLNAIRNRTSFIDFSRPIPRVAFFCPVVY